MKTLELHYPMIQFSIKHEMPFTLNEIWVESLGRHFRSCWMLPPISHCTGLNRVPLEFQFLAPRWRIGPEIRAASIHPFSWPLLQPITWNVSHYTLLPQYLSNPRYDNLHSKRSRMNERAFSTFLAAQPVMHPGHCTKTKAHGNWPNGLLQFRTNDHNLRLTFFSCLALFNEWRWSTWIVWFHCCRHTILRGEEVGALGRLLHLGEAIRESQNTGTSLQDILTATTQQIHRLNHIFWTNLYPTAGAFYFVISLFGTSKSLTKPRNNLAVVGSTIGLQN